MSNLPKNKSWVLAVSFIVYFILGLGLVSIIVDVASKVF